MTDEQLIEEAAKAIANVRWNHALPHASRGGANWTDRDLARAALTVFEKALGEATVTPTENEREALNQIFDAQIVQGWPEMREGILTILRSVRSEPSEAQVNAGAVELMRDDPEAEFGTYGFADYQNMARAVLRAANNIR